MQEKSCSVQSREESALEVFSFQVMKSMLAKEIAEKKLLELDSE